MRSRVAAACAGVLLLAACDGGTPASPEPSSTSPGSTTAPATTPTPTVAKRGWHLPLAPVTQPVYVDGVAVVFATVDGALRIVAVDPATGDKLWSRPATTSAVSAAEPLRVAVVGDKVAYYRPFHQPASMSLPVGDSSAFLVVADPHTGRDLVSSPAEMFSTPIRACDEPVTRLCVTARPFVDSAAVWSSLVIATGRWGPAPGEQPPVGSRPVGPGGLIDLGIRAPERVGVFRDNRLLWSMPVVAYFPEGSTTDAGWTFRMVDDRYLGSLDQPFPFDGDVDMGDVATASFEAGTGKIDWSVRGTSLDCRGTVVLPPDVPVRCHYRGHATFTDGVPSFAAVEVSLEGFDPDNGRRTWEFELGKGVGFLRGVRVPALYGEASLLLGRGADQRVVDLRTGEQQRPPIGAVYLCPTLTQFDSDRGTVTGDPMLATCTALRSRSAGTPSPATLLGLRQNVDEHLVVVAGPDGLTGYRLS